jgi:hypothetical protein
VVANGAAIDDRHHALRRLIARGTGQAAQQIDLTPARGTAIWAQGRQSHRQPAGQRRSIGLHETGELVELLDKPEPARCPHCNRQQPPVQLRTRRRRLYELRGPAGSILHHEIEP